MTASWIREDLLDFTAYTKPSYAQDVIRLDLNESPFALPITMTEMTFNRYPNSSELHDTMAKHYGVDTTQCLITAGSDEGINALIRLCCRAGVDNIITLPPCFSMYQFYARLQQAQCIQVPLTTDYNIDHQGIDKAVTQNSKIIFCCSPNNPTGTLIATDSLISLLTQFPQCLVVVDEAYIEFARCDSHLRLVNDFENLVILRTLSKAQGLAGIRCGVTIANAELIAHLTTISSPFALPTPTINCALQAMQTESLAQTQKNIAIIVEQRKLVYQALQQHPAFTAVVPSEANFIYALTNQAEAIAAQCRDAGIIIKSFTDACRFTVGTPEQNQRLLRSLYATG